VRTAAVCLGAALALAGCGGTAPPRADEPVPVPALTVSVLQQRVDETTRTVGVEATNSGDVAVHVSSVRLSGGGTDGPTTPLDTDLQPGLTVALRTSYGRPLCDDRADPVTAYLEVEGRLVDFPVDEAGQDEVRRLLDADCAAITLAETATVRLAGPYRRVVVDGEPRLRGRLVVTRRSPGGAVDVRSLGGSVLIDLLPVGGLVDLPAEVDRAVTPVLLGSNGRCDPHALGGSTQTFLLSAYVGLGNDPEQRVALTPPRAVQGRVLEVVTEACGTPTP